MKTSLEKPESKPLENKKLFSIKDSFEKIKRGVIDYLSGLMSRGTKPEEYLEESGSLDFLEEAARVGEEAGLYHEKMTLNSLRGTNLEYESKKETLGGIDHFNVSLYLLRDRINIDDLAADSFRSPIIDSSRENSEPHQLCLNRFRREDGQSAISEAVENIHLGKGDYWTYSSLIYEDLKTGKSIDLNRLCQKQPLSLLRIFAKKNHISTRKKKISGKS